MLFFGWNKWIPYAQLYPEIKYQYHDNFDMKIFDASNE